MFAYRLYGLDIRSELALPGPANRRRRPDILVRIRESPSEDAREDAGEYFFKTTADGADFGWKGIARFRVSSGREITVTAYPGAEESLLRTLLLGPALSVALHQRGFLLLHCSAVVLGKSAVAFLGREGEGKSTTAAALHGRGHAILTDDVLAVEAGAEFPLVSPAYPQVNLMPDAARALGWALEGLPKLHSRVEKRAVVAQRGFPQSPLPLRVVYVLESGPQSEAAPVGPQEAFLELLRHTYGTRLLKGAAAPAHFRQCGLLARSVSVRRLMVPRGLAEMACLARLVERDAAEKITG